MQIIVSGFARALNKLAAERLEADYVFAVPVHLVPQFLALAMDAINGKQVESKPGQTYEFLTGTDLTISTGSVDDGSAVVLIPAHAYTLGYLFGNLNLRSERRLCLCEHAPSARRWVSRLGQMRCGFPSEILEIAQTNLDRTNPCRKRNQPKSMTLPTIHLNGTHPQTLRHGYMSTVHKIQDAIEALENVEFHPRDYYPQGDGVWDRARKERERQLTDLRIIAHQLFEIADHCDAILVKRQEFGPQSIRSENNS